MNGRETASNHPLRSQPPATASSHLMFPVAMAQLRVRAPEDWTTLESTLIRLEAMMARRNGWLYRYQETLYLYFGVGDALEEGPSARAPGAAGRPGQGAVTGSFQAAMPAGVVLPEARTTGAGVSPAGSSSRETGPRGQAGPELEPKVDPIRLEAALECVEHLADVLAKRGGQGAVLVLGLGHVGARSAYCDAFDAAVRQLETCPGPALYLNEAIVAQLPIRTLGWYQRSPTCIEGFRQRQEVALSSRAATLASEMRSRFREAGPRVARGLHSALQWKPLILAIPGVAMFFLTPYLLELPSGDTGQESRTEEAQRPLRPSSSVTAAARALPFQPPKAQASTRELPPGTSDPLEPRPEPTTGEIPTDRCERELSERRWYDGPLPPECLD